MKIKSTIILILGLVLIAIIYSCNNSKNLNNSSLSHVEVNFSTIGNATNLQINKENILIENRTRGEEQSDRTHQKTTSSYWSKIQQLVAALDLSQIDQWEAPSNSFTFDGARGVYIQLEVDGQLYVSNTFDEGKPPVKLEKLYFLLVESLD